MTPAERATRAYGGFLGRQLLAWLDYARVTAQAQGEDVVEAQRRALEEHLPGVLEEERRRVTRAGAAAGGVP